MDIQGQSFILKVTENFPVLVPLQELTAKGGFVVVLLLLMSIIALAIVLVKLIQFSRVRMNERGFISEAFSACKNQTMSDVEKILSASRNPIARVMRVAFEGLNRREIPESVVREEVARIASEELQNLRSHMRGLEVIATLSPLLGLLGTVLGMIEAFQQLEQSGNQVNPAVLSGGIWEALLTTAVGLGVAIPSVVAFNWLERRVERLTQDMENAVTRVFTLAFTPNETGIHKHNVSDSTIPAE